MTATDPRTTDFPRSRSGHPIVPAGYAVRCTACGARVRSRAEYASASTVHDILPVDEQGRCPDCTLMNIEVPSMTRHVSPPPASPRRRRWTPPYIGDWFVRRADLSAWQVKNLDRASRQVQLVPDIGGKGIWITADDLARDYEKTGA